MRTLHLNAFVSESASMLTYGPPVDSNGMATLLFRGRRLNEFVPLADWQKFSPQCPTLFSCAFCAAPVIIFAVEKHSRQPFQACRCTIINFLVASPFQTQEQWTNWQKQYLREMADPAPFPLLKEGVLMGKIDGEGADWLSRRFNLPAGLQWHTDGTISAGKASISFSPTSTLTTVDCDNPQDNARIVELTRKLHENGLEPPERLVIPGRDPDYVWPAGVVRSTIRTLPYRCDYCSAWVKLALLSLPAYDRVLVCLCHAIIFRKDIAHPQNYRQWRELLVATEAEKYRHPASANN